jgi:hypothetical protein
MIGRKVLPPELVGPFDAFQRVLEEIEPAKAGVADVLPGTRLPGRPLNDAVAEYRARLERARQLMPAWRCAPLEPEWRACDEGIEVALDRAARLLHRDRDPEAFEGLLGTAEQLLDPLEPFAAAAERFRTLRRRPSRSDEFG